VTNLKSQIDVLNLPQNQCFVWVTNSTVSALKPTAIALGNFDGLHRGHQRVIQPILHPQSASSHHSTVVTFNPHPQEFFTGQPRALLTPLDEKVSQLRSLGVKQLVLLPFDRELAALTPQEFVWQILVQQLQVQCISVGQDFCFGRHRSGTASDLQLIAAQYNIPVTIVPLLTCTENTNDGNLRISSSAIRQNLESGNILQANHLLGRPYQLRGTVVEGKQLGRTIGFPTANLQLPPEKFLPRQGVYAVSVFIEHETIDPEQAPVSSFPGVMNIGNRPTVNGTHPTIEVHLLDWSGDLYAKTLTVKLKHFLRPEQKFSDLDALKAQIQLDSMTAREMLKNGT
jgi:riboflavin kinase / FMN adenylyltransferase